LSAAEDRGSAAEDRQFPSKSQSADLKLEVPISIVSSKKSSSGFSKTIAEMNVYATE
jgi:hypothetical protein